MRKYKKTKMLEQKFSNLLITPLTEEHQIIPEKKEVVNSESQTNTSS